MYKVKVYGAGSIGNHLANAARHMGWSVDICDLDANALKRTKNEIYPQRYGSWDDEIGLYLPENEPKGIYDMVFIGTPPDSHMELAISAINEGAKTLLVEKPVCTPNLNKAQEFYDLVQEKKINAFVGYDHVVADATKIIDQRLSEKKYGKVETLDVEFREHWGGIFGAHPWLEGPWDTYLGFWEKGGGAAGEHSHAVNLWQHFANELQLGRVIEVSASLDFVKNNQVSYDKLALFNLKTDKGLLGRVVQDVVTKPHKKFARVQTDKGFLEWQCGVKQGTDLAMWSFENQENQEHFVTKTRPDDFIAELKHIKSVIESDDLISPISIERGLDTMLVVAAAHKSALLGKRINIDYSKGYTEEALKF